MNVQAIRQLAEKFSVNELELCVDDQLNNHNNLCYRGSSEEETIDSLSKASYIRQLMDDENLTLNDAIRKLTRTIRELNLKWMEQILLLRVTENESWAFLRES